MTGESGEATISVLHVDDQTHVRELLSTFLQRLDRDVTVHSESRPKAALQLIETHPIDCVVSDYEMPVMDGIEFLEAVRGDYPNLPFILFTGAGGEEVAAEAINAGVTDYLQKEGSDSYRLLANQIRNVVSHRRSEDRAKIARTRLIKLYEQTDGFYTLDGDWTITYWNQQIAERTGLSTDDVIGRDFWTVFPEAVGTRVHDNYRTAMETREQVEFEVYYEPYDYWVELRVYPVEGGLFVHSRDITEKREKSQELQYRNELLESFASTVSHDLRNPLNVAEGNLQLAQETGDFEHLEAVAKAHNRMRNLIDELLQVARGEDLEEATVSLSAIAARAWETVSSDGADLAVENDIDFKAYQGQVRRLFENLFWNAIDHGDATRIQVGALESGFYVEDNGEGIPPKYRERVFESGFSTDEESPGYGLSIVTGIAEVHDWEIRVTDGEDGGARFEVTEIERPDE
ncbi:ATP-binding response regulator [Halobellus rarus]|uniref:histidine kinase n=1 Tax=Halobellus rarus TaxID=1126237 RepID=A0ABD6CNR3_9EURY|nr:response regulator [Halobellus rarus]